MVGDERRGGVECDQLLSRYHSSNLDAHRLRVTHGLQLGLCSTTPPLAYEGLREPTRSGP